MGGLFLKTAYLEVGSIAAQLAKEEAKALKGALTSTKLPAFS
jgi:hypothetical protein